MIDGSPLFVRQWLNFLLPANATDENLQQIIATGLSKKISMNKGTIAESCLKKHQIRKLQKLLKLD